MNEIANFELLESKAESLDASDSLADFQTEFYIPSDENGDREVYFVGNSLGLQPKLTESYILADLANWKELGVRGHFEGEHPWLQYHELLTAPMARIVGGKESEVVVMNGLTTNLHLMMATFYRPEKKRSKILLEQHAFPSDHYAIHSQVQWHGLDPHTEMVVLDPDEGEELISTDKVLQAIDYYRETLALVLLPGIQYYTGQVFDMQAIAESAHKYDIPVGFDLAHAAGNVELNLNQWDVDFAVWCTYKYLNSGPGAVAGCFVNERHATNPRTPRLAGWWGHDKQTRFQMQNEFKPIPTVEGWQLSNPPILSLSAIRASLELFERATMPKLIEKSKALTGFFIECLDQILADDVQILTPREPERRGCQLSLQINSKNISGKEVYQRLEESAVRTDWREPNVIRAAPVPMYNSFSDVLKFCTRLQEIIAG